MLKIKERTCTLCKHGKTKLSESSRCVRCIMRKKDGFEAIKQKTKKPKKPTKPKKTGE